MDNYSIYAAALAGDYDNERNDAFYALECAEDLRQQLAAEHDDPWERADWQAQREAFRAQWGYYPGERPAFVAAVDDVDDIPF